MTSEEERHEFEHEFGQTLERERLRRGWTAEEAANRAGVAPKTWQRIEDGKPVRNLTLSKVDKLFGIPEGTAYDAWEQRSVIRLQDELARMERSLRGLTRLIPSDLHEIPDFASPQEESRPHRGLASLIPTDSSEIADLINSQLTLLTVGDLDRVSSRAAEVRDAKEVEILRMYGLIGPMQVYRAYSVGNRFETGEWRNTLLPLVERYSKVANFVVDLSDSLAEAKQAYARAASAEAKQLVEQLTKEHWARVREAAGTLREIAQSLDLFTDKTDSEDVRLTALAVGDWAKRAEMSIDGQH